MQKPLSKVQFILIFVDNFIFIFFSNNVQLLNLLCLRYYQVSLIFSFKSSINVYRTLGKQHPIYTSTISLICCRMSIRLAPTIPVEHGHYISRKPVS